jgi:hypothetical protein
MRGPPGPLAPSRHSEIATPGIRCLGRVREWTQTGYGIGQSEPPWWLSLRYARLWARTLRQGHTDKQDAVPVIKDHASGAAMTLPAWLGFHRVLTHKLGHDWQPKMFPDNGGCPRGAAQVRRKAKTH